ncbi:MAG: FAD-dependent oxidoreductase, partial [Pacificimonas sp.]
MAHVQEVIAGIAPHDSVERFEGLGAHVVKHRAVFTGRKTVEAGGETYRAKRFVIATGSRARIFPIPGLDEVDHLTNETIWALTERPGHLLILGGGNIGVEMAQAFRRLGSKVTIVEKNEIMANDDRELVAVVHKALSAEGVAIHENTDVSKIRKTATGITIDFERGDSVEGSHLLVATGRQANVENLGLDVAGVKLGKDAIKVDARLRTSNKKIFAVGDCREGPQFTHAAGYDGGIAVRNICFRLPAKADYSALPWVTFTDPELANVGLTEKMARDKGLRKITTVEAPLGSNDRARAERRGDGKIKIVLSNGKIVGCGIVGLHAGELIHPWALGIAQGLKPSQMTGYIAPYPTLGEITKAGTNELFKEKLFSKPVRMLVGLLSKLP